MMSADYNWILYDQRLILKNPTLISAKLTRSSKNKSKVVDTL